MGACKDRQTDGQMDRQIWMDGWMVNMLYGLLSTVLFATSLMESTTAGLLVHLKAFTAFSLLL